MNSFILMIPFIFIRFGLLSILDKNSLKRATFFAPLVGNEKVAYFLYQLSSIFIFFYPFFIKTRIVFPWFVIGIILYLLGILICTFSIISFSKPEISGINLNGIYQISRNPMYLGYLFYFFGVVLLSYSALMFLVLIIFQLSAHWIILSEERWCLEEFGNDYSNYMKKVRRYI